MRRINYSTLRHLTFSAYVLIAVLFCILLLYLGKKEILKARSYAEHERIFFESLISSRKYLNSVEQHFNTLLRNPCSDNAEQFRQQVRLLRQTINTLARSEKNRAGSSPTSIPLLQENSQLLYSTAWALCEDMKAPPLEKQILFKQDADQISGTLKEIREKIQTLFKTELDHIEIWQRYSSFFFNRLQYLLVLFFILTTVFSVAASFFFGYMLRRSLRELSGGAREISSGNLKYRFRDILPDEIGGVMYDFNLMAHRLEQQTKELHNANRKLEEKAAQLIEAHRHKDIFLANMSHELRTPLSSILGFSELMIAKAKTSGPSEKKKFLHYSNRILMAAEHLFDLISDLLDVAKVEAGVLKPVFKDFQLSACINEVINITRPLAEQKKLKLEINISEKITLNADKRLIRQILINLINNAIKFTAEGSITVNASIDDDYCKIDIKDTGIGIKKEDQKTIFEDFRRIETGLTSNYEGVGLGLTLSKRLVELHGGKITVESEPGKGSVFSVFLPLNKPKERNDVKK